MRLANELDINELCKIRILQQKDDWKEEFIDNNLYDTTKKYLEKHLNKDLIIFLNEIDNNIIATCGLQIIEYLPQCNDNGKQGYICNVFTHKDHRRKGIQTKLLNNVIAYAKENDICELNLSSDNKNAINLYKKFGFEFDELMMTLDLK